MVQSNIENRAYQVQRLLADKLDEYKEKQLCKWKYQRNSRIIQEEREKAIERWIQDKEVLLYKLYEILT